jgi:hypothetical protein
LLAGGERDSAIAVARVELAEELLDDLRGPVFAGFRG